MIGYILRRGRPPSSCSLNIASALWNRRQHTSRKTIDWQIFQLTSKSKSQPDTNLDTIIIEALDYNLFALAAKFCLDNYSKVPSQSILFKLIRGLVTFDPVLTPLHIRTLWLLQQRFPEEVSLTSIEKGAILDAVMSWSRSSRRMPDIDLMSCGAQLAMDIGQGPIPVSKLMELVQIAEKHGQVRLLSVIWRYIQDQYPLSALDYVPIVTRVMRLFARTERYHPMAGAIASTLAQSHVLRNHKSGLDPAVVTSIARVAYKLKDTDLASILLDRLDADSADSRPALGALLALYTSINDTENALVIFEKLKKAGSKGKLTTEEWSSLVKAITESHGIAEAQSFASINNRGPRNSLADVALCHQAIHDGDRDRFKQFHRQLQAEGKVKNGILLNLVLEWELRNKGSFEQAKRHYQNWIHKDGYDLKQIQIALNTLIGIAARSDVAFERYRWILSEAKRQKIPLYTTKLEIRRRSNTDKE